jgi:hypothetical protein
LAGELKHTGLGKGASLADDLEAGGGEHLVMDAGGVLKGRGGQEDAGSGGHGAGSSGPGRKDVRRAEPET